MKQSHLTNYHSHCSFCDGRYPMEEFVRAAIQEGFYSYGVSSHAPLPFPTHWTMNQEDMSAYLAEFSRIKGQYGSQIELYLGLEIDYLNEAHHPAIPYFQELPLDYRIGSIHMLKNVSGEMEDVDCSKETFREKLHACFDNDLEAVLHAYYEAQLRMLELGGFDILGHCDKINSRAEFCRPGILQESWFRKLMDSFFDAIADSGIMLEVNTKKYLPEGVFFPDKSYFSAINARHIPVVVNSDAHYIQKLNDGRPEALSLLYAAGYRTVRELHSGQWMDVTI